MKAVKRLTENICTISFSGDDFYKSLEQVRSVLGAKYNPKKKNWEAPIIKQTIEKLASFGFDIDMGILEQICKKEEVKEIIISDDIKKGLFPFQAEDIAAIEKFNGSVLIGNEMGTGKTIEALSYLKLHLELRPALIVCPNSLKLNWAEESKKWISKEKGIQVLSSKTEIDLSNSIFIINYDILAKFEEELIQIKPKIMIIDESHRIKNRSAKRTKSVRAIAKVSGKFIALSGTPIINRPVEFFNVLNILRPTLFNSFYKFVTRYCAPKYNGFGWNYNGSSNLDELHKILMETCMIRRLKKDVLKELPDKIISILPVNSFPKELKQEYQTAVDDMIITIKNEKGEKQNVELMNILHQIEVLKQLAFKMKFDLLVEWIEDFLESGKKLVVFCNHHFAIDELVNKFPKLSVKLDGRDNITERNLAVMMFMNDPNVKLFVGNIKAAGEGITLTVADTCLITELPWTPGECSQAEDRLHRIGQKESVNIYYMIATGTIEEDIINLIDTKRKILDKTLDGIDTDQNSLVGELIKRFKE